jgi:hypothetical protein
MKTIVLGLITMLITLAKLRSQDYHGLQGSSYAGVLGVSNNPASIVNVPFKWDINVFSAQAKYSTNAVSVLKYSLLSSPANSQYKIDNGDYERYARANFNIHLLNARIAINRTNSVAFGVNLRGYSGGTTGKYNFVDSIVNFRGFFNINQQNPFLQGKVVSSTWLEVFGTYGRMLFDTEIGRLNAGITVKAMRGVSGAFASLQSGSVKKSMVNNRTVYMVNGGGARYGYSSNFDKWKKNRTTSENLQDLMAYSQGSFSVDLGFEYLVKSQEIYSYNDDERFYDYDWKIGVGLLDIGSVKYKYGIESRVLNSPKADISDVAFQKKFNDLGSVSEFNDSISTVFTSVSQLFGNFAVANPARLVINVDRYLSGNFYLNGEASVNLSPLAGNEKLYVTSLSLLTITPRWETRRLGFYLPFTFNTEKQFWLGAAFKAGPLVLGVHNLGNIFSQNKMHSGGGYIALILRPGNQAKARRDSRYNCPQF